MQQTEATRPLSSYPLSQAQLRVYRASLEDPDKPINHLACGFRLPAKVDTKLLTRAVRSAIDAHPLLKCRIYTDPAGRPRMRRNDEDTAAVRMEFLSEGGLDTWAKGFLRPFALNGGALYRFSVVKAYRATYLFCDVHRLVCDDASLVIFLQDVSAAYHGVQLKPEEWTGYDLANQECIQRKNGGYSQTRAFYAERFGGLPPQRKPLPDSSVSAGKAEFTLPTGVAMTSVHDFCAQVGCEPDTPAAAAFGLTLGAYTNAQEVLFTVAFNMRASCAARTVALFSRVLPVHLVWDGTTSPHDLADLLMSQRLLCERQSALAAGELSRAAHVSGEPQFAYDGAVNEVSELCGFSAEVVPFAREAGESDLFVRAYPEAGELMVHITYQASLYTESFVRGFAQTYASVLSGLLTCTSLEQIAFINAEQRSELDTFNPSADQDDESQTVLSLFRATAADHPTKTAVVAEDVELSYSQLDRRSDDIAALAALAGLKTNDVALVLVPRDERMVLAPLGVAKAGGAYLPLSATMSREQVSQLVELSGAKLLVTTDDLRVLVRTYEGPVLYVPVSSHNDDYSDQLRLEGGPHYKGRVKPVVPQPDVVPRTRFVLPCCDLAQDDSRVAELTHGNVASLSAWYRQAFSLNSASRVSASSSLCSADSLMDLFCPLTCGATVCIGPNQDRTSGADLGDAFGALGVTHLHVSANKVAELAPLATWRGLRVVLARGKQDGPVLMPRRVELHYLQGFAEDAGCVACKAPEVEHAGGKAVLGVELYVVDAHMRRLPVGACGELLVAGPRVGLGYLGLPEQTGESFVGNPFDEGAFGRAHKTGRMARFCANGEVEFVDAPQWFAEREESERQVGDVPDAQEANELLLDGDANEQEAVAVGAPAKEEQTHDEPEAVAPMEGPSHDEPDEAPAAASPAGEPPAESRPERRKRSGRTSSTRRSSREDKPKPVVAESKPDTSDAAEQKEPAPEVLPAQAPSFDQQPAHISAPARASHFAPAKTPEASQAPAQDDDLMAYDYTAINQLLAKNVPPKVDAIFTEGMGDILLVGVNSLLGAHVLKAFLTCHRGKAWCLVPHGARSDPEGFLAQVLAHYTGESFDDLLGERIRGVVDGADALAHADELYATPFRTLVNCAGFEADQAYDLQLVAGSLADLCAHERCRMVHVSSLAVAGEADGAETFAESSLFVGQRFANEHSRGLFLAEREVLERVAQGKLDGKVIRVDGLCPALRGACGADAREERELPSLLAEYGALGAFPVGRMGAPLVLTPVDKAAEALLKLGASGSRFSVFHVRNSHEVQMGDAVYALREAGVRLRVVPDDYFARMEVEAELGSQHGNARVSAHFTNQALYYLDWRWPLVDEAYLARAVGA